MKGIPAVLDADVEERQGQQRDIWIAMVDELNDLDGSFPCRIALLRVDQVDDFEVERQIRFEVGYGIAGIVCSQAVSNRSKVNLPRMRRTDEALKLRPRGREPFELVSNCHPGRRCLHARLSGCFKSVATRSTG